MKNLKVYAFIVAVSALMLSGWVLLVSASPGIVHRWSFDNNNLSDAANGDPANDFFIGAAVFANASSCKENPCLWGDGAAWPGYNALINLPYFPDGQTETFYFAINDSPTCNGQGDCVIRSTYGNSYQVYVHRASGEICVMADCNAVEQCLSGVDIRDGVPRLYAHSWGAEGSKWYLNGSLIGNASCLTLPTDSPGGCDGYACNAFFEQAGIGNIGTGWVDDVIMWNESLSPSQVLGLANGTFNYTFFEMPPVELPSNNNAWIEMSDVHWTPTSVFPGEVAACSMTAVTGNDTLGLNIYYELLLNGVSLGSDGNTVANNTVMEIYWNTTGASPGDVYNCTAHADNNLNVSITAWATLTVNPPPITPINEVTGRPIYDTLDEVSMGLGFLFLNLGKGIAALLIPLIIVAGIAWVIAAVRRRVD